MARKKRTAARKKRATKTRRKGRVLKASWHQTGSSDRKRDKKRHAMPPGKRMSRNGKVYYEYRRNRSDRGQWL